MARSATKKAPAKKAAAKKAAAKNVSANKAAAKKPVSKTQPAETEMFNVGQSLASATDVKRITDVARSMYSLEQNMEAKAAELDELKKQHNHLKMKVLPDMMASAGLTEFTLDNGYKLTVETFYAGSLPKDDTEREAAISWLEEHGGSDIIKTEIALAFSKNEHNFANHIAEVLRGEGCEFDEKFGVHASTLQSFCREAMTKGENVPLELLGIHSGKVAKLKNTNAKGRKGKADEKD